MVREGARPEVAVFLASQADGGSAGGDRSGVS